MASSFTAALFYARNFVESCWNLPLTSSAFVSRSLLSWKVKPQSVDSGVPEQIRKVLSEAFCELGPVAFIKTIPGGLQRLISRREITFGMTRDPERVADLFDSGTVSWEMQVQRIFLSASQRNASAMSEKHLFPVDFETVSRAGFRGIVLPGVDGDAAGIYCLDAEFDSEVYSAVSVACPRNGCEFRQVTETELRHTISDAESA